MKAYTQNAQNYIELTKNVDLSETYKKVLPHFSNCTTLLDVGCGSGRDALFFHHQGFKVTATDLSAEMIELIKPAMPFPVIVQDILNPSINETFDAAWACASLLHIPTESQARAFKNIANLLKPQGIVYCSYKLGTSERIDNNLIYRDYTEAHMTPLQDDLNLFTIKDFWISADTLQQANRPDWINFILVKK